MQRTTASPSAKMRSGCRLILEVTPELHSRISLSCSSFLCFSILSSCSKKRSWERTSADCS
ncbi:hypothetical protein EYF80_027594 [Liparis tanakae]|uniref:Uncharacterized protein n=1 Tax=Liparis tanakae TaxID=230148 RepID=A0A4Z2HBF4_9TELE|nr:hypothetical protein EYF80_027594 [Liparis tanakae]